VGEPATADFDSHDAAAKAKDKNLNRQCAVWPGYRRSIWDEQALGAMPPRVWQTFP
jgi:hypothetical protein